MAARPALTPRYDGSGRMMRGSVGSNPTNYRLLFIIRKRMTKRCLKCGTTKDLNEFLVKPGQRVGARGICKKCFEDN